MNKITGLIVLILSTVLITQSAFAYKQTFANNTGNTLEIRTGYAAWGTRHGLRLEPGHEYMIDTGALNDHKWVSDVLCLNEITIRKVPVSEGYKATVAVKDAAELGSGYAAFQNISITWVDDPTLARINSSIMGAIETIDAGKNIIAKGASTITGALAGIIASAVVAAGTSGVGALGAPAITAAITGVAMAIGDAVTAFDLTKIPKIFDVFKISLCTDRRFDIFEGSKGELYLVGVTK